MSNQARFQAAALPHLRELFGTACRVTRSRAHAETLVHETVLRAYRESGELETGTNMRAHLYTTLHRVQNETFAHDALAMALEDADEAESAGPPTERAVAQVPEPYRTAVLLRDVQDFTYGEITQITSVPVHIVMSRVHHGRSILRRFLEDHRS